MREGWLVERWLGEGWLPKQKNEEERKGSPDGEELPRKSRGAGKEAEKTKEMREERAVPRGVAAKRKKEQPLWLPRKKEWRRGSSRN